jgi:hypothetical protein
MTKMALINKIILVSLLLVIAACASNKTYEDRSVATYLTGDRVPVTITPDGKRVYISEESHTFPIMKGDYREHIQDARTRGSVAGCKNTFVVVEYIVTTEKEIENIRFVHPGSEICNNIVLASILRIEILQPASSGNIPFDLNWRSLFIFDPMDQETLEYMRSFLRKNQEIVQPPIN